MHEIAARKGDFTLFALFMRAGAPGTRDLVVSAPWLETGRLQATGSFVKLLSQSIGEESLKQFSRVATVGSDAPVVRFILENLPVDDRELHVASTDLVRFQIEEAIIFRAKKPREDRSGLPRKVLHPTAGGHSRGRA